MRTRLERIRMLLRRYQVDRRLPPPVLGLIRTTARLRLVDRMHRVVSRCRPVLGASTDGTVARLANRRLVTQGSLDRSVSDAALDHAERVEQVFAAAGVPSFVVRRSGDRVELGLFQHDRSAAADALRSGLSDWYAQTFDRCVRLLALDAGGRLSSLATARAWRVFPAVSWGEVAIGPAFGVDITFWELGTSGEFELIGTRSHERFHPDSPETTESVDGRAFRGRSAFPVGRSLERLDQPVDIVFTWVDGSDPAWLEAFRRTMAEYGRLPDEVALDPARYRSRDELRYALRSVWAYCGWVRSIHVVTAGQRPPWLRADAGRFGLHIVDHASILPAEALPTFNSHSIESSLHHIDGLAEHFVYCNDDMLIGRPIRPELFFTSNGLARVFQGGARVHGHEHAGTLAVDTAALRGRELLADRFGRVVTHKPLHAPYPLRRSTLLEIDREFPDAVGRTVASRFRSPGDLSIAASFGQHYGLARGQSVLGDIATEYVHVESARLGWHLDRIRLSDDLDSYCINETSDGRGRPERESSIAEFFESCLPVPAPWEADR